MIGQYENCLGDLKIQEFEDYLNSRVNFPDRFGGAPPLVKAPVQPNVSQHPEYKENKLKRAPVTTTFYVLIGLLAFVLLNRAILWVYFNPQPRLRKTPKWLRESNFRNQNERSGITPGMIDLPESDMRKLYKKKTGAKSRARLGHSAQNRNYDE